MPRKASPRKKRPSGIETSANGKYFYWKCNVSGMETFCDERRFKEVVAKYGDEATLFKTYVLRPVKKYVDAGFDAEHIKNLIKHNDGKLPSIDGKLKERKAAIKALKKPRKVRLKKFAVGEVGIQQLNASGSIEEVKQKIYPWTGNPDYFRGGPPVPFDIGEVTKNVCLYPARHIDDLCEGCPVFSECQCPAKISDEDRRSAKHRRHVPVVKAIVLDEDGS